MVYLLAFLTFFGLVGGVASAATCDAQKALLYSSLANNFVNGEHTHENGAKASRFAGLAVEMNAACIRAATSVDEVGAYYLSTAHNVMIAATVQEDLGHHDNALHFANMAMKIWREIVAERAYPASIRQAAQREIDAAK